MDLNQTPQDKFKVYDQPYPSPHKCVSCGMSHDGNGKVKFIDTGYDLDYYGVILICSNCFLEMANAFKYLAPEQYTKVAADGVTALAENVYLKEQNEHLRTTIASLAAHRCDSPVSSSSVVSVEAPGDNGESPKDTALNGVGKSSDVNEPDVSKGLPDVRGTSTVKPRPVKPTGPTDLSELVGF